MRSGYEINRAYSKFFHENNYTPGTVIFNCRYRFFFLVGAGGDGKEIARVGKRIFVSFAWGSVYRFPFYSLVLLCFATENGLTR